MTIAVPTILLLIAVLVSVTWWWDQRDERCVSEASDVGYHDEATEVSDAGRQLQHGLGSAQALPGKTSFPLPEKTSLRRQHLGTSAQRERRHSMPSVSGDYHTGEDVRGW